MLALKKRHVLQVISTQFLSGAPQLQTLRLWHCKPRNMFLIINKSKTEKPYVKTSRLFVRLNSSDSATTTNGGEKRRELLIKINALYRAKRGPALLFKRTELLCTEIYGFYGGSEITHFIFTKIVLI